MVTNNTYTSITEKSEIDLILDIENEKKYIHFLTIRLEELNNVSMITDPASKELAETQAMIDTNKVFLKHQPGVIISVKVVPEGVFFKPYIPLKNHFKDKFI